MSAAPVIVWFRTDLRLTDNPALVAAAAAGPVVPVYIHAPEEEGDWPPGAASRWWLHHSLVVLDGSLRARGSRLIVRRGPSRVVLQELIEETGAQAVFWNRRYEPAVLARDQRLQSELPARTFNGALLVEPWELKPYKVFTAFWRACTTRLTVPPPQPVPTLRNPRRWPESLTVMELGLLPKINWAAQFPWQPGEAGARRLLKRFLRTAAASYRTQRELPAVQGTSRLSPHLHFGEMSVRQLWHAVAVTEFRRQLGWREFAHHLLFHFPQTPTDPLRPDFTRFPWRNDLQALRAWQRGQTGFPIVDAGMRELWTTGWMHNRVRMIVASFLVKDLLIPWQQGARWFWDTLVDADLANNTLGWQWVAGCGADAAPYFRVFNPELQAARFDPQAEYVRRWVPEVGTSQYPQPIVDHSAAHRRALAAYEQIKATAKTLGGNWGR